MDNLEKDKKVVWRRIGIVAVLLVLIVGPNFGPLPNLLGQSFSINNAVLLLLASFILGFSIIIALILKMSGMRLKELLNFVGLGAPSRPWANVVGALLGLVWGMLFLSSIFQFDPNVNIAEISGIRILAAVIAAIGALLEDVVTRGYVMNKLRDIDVPGWMQVVIGAVLFALYHTVWGFNIYSFIFSIVYGLMLGGLYLWGKRSLTAVILGHSLAVLISEPFSTMMIFLSAGL
ncbi:MAG: CPBP family intramembrane metalloprotease [Anaerolineales bacterium]|nr:CPBP family intramembrane metalloprotease [Anaerolineales bacterium]